MSKVYVVTNGCYSDYHIVRVFSTKELALEFTGSILEQSTYDYSIEEWALDLEDGMVVRPRWTGNMYLIPFAPPYQKGKVFQAGEIDDIHQSYEIASKHLRNTGIKFEYCPKEEGRFSHPEKYRIWVTSYVSKEHCEKLLIEGRQQWLRDGSPKDWKGTVTFREDS